MLGPFHPVEEILCWPRKYTPHDEYSNPRRKGLFVVDLDNPYDTPRYLNNTTSWDAADVQWSPWANKDFWVVSTVSAVLCRC
jgi:hypothetical protein